MSEGGGDASGHGGACRDKAAVSQQRIRVRAELVWGRRRVHSCGFGFVQSLSGRSCRDGCAGGVVQKRGCAGENAPEVAGSTRRGSCAGGGIPDGLRCGLCRKGRKWCRSGLAGWAGIGGIVSAGPVEASGALGRGRACRSEWAEALLLGFRSIFDCSRAAMR